MPDSARRGRTAGTSRGGTSPRVATTVLFLVTGLGGALARGADPPASGYRRDVGVTAPTRIDWIFALANQSPPRPPDDWLRGYDSTAQSYELFVPARRQSGKPLPLVVFISPGREPSGWRHFAEPCQDAGILFAGVRGAGNDCEPKTRVRIVLDVLDDVRRRFPTDPDRTYLAGFSGGGRVACAIAFALPEYFGGVIPICASGDLRDESWLRRRVADRLSVALLSGESDFNRGEVERLRGPFLSEVGVRARVWVEPGLGHAMPSEKTLREALRWLDEGATRRGALAGRYPAMRVAGDAAPGRDEWARLLLAEGKRRLKDRATLYSGLMQLQGCLRRWPDLEVADEARTILLDYERRPRRPWEAEDIAEQRLFLIARARSLDAYASGDLPDVYQKMRPVMLRNAIQLWKQVLADGPRTEPGIEAKARISALEKHLSPSDE